MPGPFWCVMKSRWAVVSPRHPPIRRLRLPECGEAESASDRPDMTPEGPQTALQRTSTPSRTALPVWNPPPPSTLPHSPRAVHGAGARATLQQSRPF